MGVLSGRKGMVRVSGSCPRHGRISDRGPGRSWCFPLVPMISYLLKFLRIGTISASW